MKYICLCLLVLTVCVSAAETNTNRGIAVVRKELGPDVSIPNYHALIIGINTYKHWQSLRQAREDAQEVATQLGRRYGFKDIVSLYDKDATGEAIEVKLRNFTKTLTEKDALLVYFSGHGYYDRMTKRGYWVPTDARESVEGEPATRDWLHNTQLKEYLAAMKARQVLVVSDSCFSGALFKGPAEKELGQKENAWLRKAIEQPIRYCITSGDLETVPDESPFARKFVSILQYPRKKVFGATEVLGWIRNEVAAEGKTQPLGGGLLDSVNSPNGDFVFLACYDDGETAQPVVGSAVGISAAKKEVSKSSRDLTIDLGDNVKMEFVWIPAGEFDMGSTEGSDEQPVHRVKLTKSLLMGKHEVTQEQWTRVMGTNPSQFKNAKSPVENVSWDDCQVFLKELNALVSSKWSTVTPAGVFRLPTEAEWEYACRAGTQTRFSSGDAYGSLTSTGWYSHNGDKTSHPVGMKKPNAFGLHDMHGNVWEWCQDWYGPYSSNAVSDATGPSSGEDKVIRGGSWGSGPEVCRTAKRQDGSARIRFDCPPTERNSSLGFRVTAEAPTSNPGISASTASPSAPMKIDLGGAVKMEFVWIPALKGWVGKYEVTNQEYRRFRKDHDSGKWNDQTLNEDRQPVTEVSYTNAILYAEWVNHQASSSIPSGYRVRLPDGKEWMTFAQCGDGRTYPWGNTLPPKYGNYADTTAKRLFPTWTDVVEGYDDGCAVSCHVEKSGENDWGLHGVGGNVWEWTTEQEGSERVLRGASWNFSKQLHLRCECRSWHPPLLHYIGFRLVVLR